MEVLLQDIGPIPSNAISFERLSIKTIVILRISEIVLSSIQSAVSQYVSSHFKNSFAAVSLPG
jgi:hypothetical protein